MDNFEKVAGDLVIYRLRKAWLELSRFFNQKAAGYGATLPMGFVLLTINEEFGTPVTKIAPRIGMEPNSLGRLLKSLEEKGLVVRKNSDEDKRKVHICLTEEGKRMRDVAAQTVFKMEESITTGIAPEHLAGFFGLLDHVPNAIDALKSEPQEQG